MNIRLRLYDACMNHEPREIADETITAADFYATATHIQIPADAEHDLRDASKPYRLRIELEDTTPPSPVHEPGPSVGIEKEYRRGETARNRSIGIGGDCTGSPLCAAEITIEHTDTSQWDEIHLTVDEAEWAIAKLQAAVASYRARRVTP